MSNENQHIFHLSWLSRNASLSVKLIARDAVSFMSKKKSENSGEMAHPSCTGSVLAKNWWLRVWAIICKSLISVSKKAWCLRLGGYNKFIQIDSLIERIFSSVNLHQPSHMRSSILKAALLTKCSQNNVHIWQFVLHCSIQNEELRSNTGVRHRQITSKANLAFVA